MRIKTLKLWNFRKYGSGNDDLDIEKPDIVIPFTQGLNVLIGENDSGKTAIIDAIKLILDTHSTEWNKLSQEDFYNNAKRLRVECTFTNLDIDEAKNFTEWLGMEGIGETAKPYLKVILDASRNDDRILPFDIRAGADDEGIRLTAEARDYLRTTYLKPLRDAKSELIPRRNSRLSQILSGHSAFKGKEKEHTLKNLSKCWDCLFQKYFKNTYKPDDCVHKLCPHEKVFYPDQEQEGEGIKNSLQLMVNDFFGHNDYEAGFGILDRELKNILEQFKLTLADDKLGLGSQNLLFMATELLNLKREQWTGTRIALIEELEAHLHPQAQMRVIEYLEKFTDDKNGKDVQIILTTHSPNLASKVKLENLIICHGGHAFPLGKEYTMLEENDYSFLERFLDATKANLFFAKGVILVEGWTEEIILPVLAKRIGINLTEKSVSIVNVGNTAFLRYAKIFQRKDGQELNIPVAIVTDLDVKPDKENEMQDGKAKKDNTLQNKQAKYNSQKVKAFISPHWTLEYCLSLNKTLAPYMYKAIKEAIKEMRADGKSMSEIAETYEVFSNGKTSEDIAFNIHQGLIIDKKISKPILAQHLVRIGLLRKCADAHVELDDNNTTKYLIDAIKYASGN